jgi:CheY-like chemotaxis protein/HPt (histidine-containing phosphotransfer) domain-containing protein
LESPMHESKGNPDLEETKRQLQKSLGDLREIKEAVERANRTRKEFLTVLGREIQTSAQAIVGMAELLRNASLSLERQEDVRVLRAAGGSILNLIDDILDLSRVEVGRSELETIGLSLREAVETTWNAVRDENPMKILLVENVEANRLLVEAYLKKNPYEIETAENGEIALKKFTSGRYDMVLMELQLPDMDGYTAAQAIRSWEREYRAEPTPIIALTASDSEEDATKSLEAGCDAHLSKPIRKKDLLRVILEHTQDTPLGEEAAKGGNRLGTAESETVVVHADPDVADLIPWYLEKTGENTKAVEEALLKADFETITAVGRQMEGSGVNYGFPAISDLGRRLEKSAGDQNAEMVEETVEALSLYLDRLEVVYD